ncbi:MAG: isochorismate synthase MenF [Haloferacaceae archaeon]
MNSPRSDATGARLVSRATRIDDVPVRAVLAAASSTESDGPPDPWHPRTVWDAPGEPTVVAGGVAAELTAEGEDRFDSVRRAADALLADADLDASGVARPRLFGGFAFHADRHVDDPERGEVAHGDTDPGGRDVSSVWAGFPGARFVLPRVQVVWDEDGTWLTVSAVGPEATEEAVERRLATERDRLASLPEPGDVAEPPGIDGLEHVVPREAWCAGVAAAIDRIEAGELSKVVLAQVLEARLRRPLSLPSVLARLGETYPDCYRFLIEPTPAAAPPSTEGSATDTPSFFGATPERLVRLEGRQLRTGALAGTTGRGETSAEDEWLAEELLDSAKNAREHDLVVEAVRDQLEPFAASISTGERRVRRLATVQHLWTPIAADLAADEHVLSLVAALHPTPAVGGLPPERALATIRETEPFDRGWYAAPVGWFDAEGDGSFAVAIRSAVARGRTATLFAGVGVVADSDPDAEWDEAQLKYRPILDELDRD